MGKYHFVDIRQIGKIMNVVFEGDDFKCRVMMFENGGYGVVKIGDEIRADLHSKTTEGKFFVRWLRYFEKNGEFYFDENITCSVYFRKNLNKLQDFIRASKKIDTEG